jgi:hypothetical protein
MMWVERTAETNYLLIAKESNHRNETVPVIVGPSSEKYSASVLVSLRKYIE